MDNVMALVQFAKQQDAVSFKDTFDQIMAAKVSDAVMAHREVVGKDMFTTPNTDSQEDTDEDS
jgi:hypothetical protein